MCRYLLWTLREPATALDAWRELLKPGGVVVAVDGPWFAGGINAAADDERPDFRRHYDARVFSSLPLAAIPSPGPIVAAFADAGFENVSVELLPQIEAVERANVQVLERICLQFMISARRAR